MLRLPPLSLYLHIPWCFRKCPYCDFNSYGRKGEIDEERYVDALLRDFEEALPRVRDRPFQSLFIGGGTPSLFSGEAVSRLLERIGGRAEFDPDVEITLEANPGASERMHFSAYRTAGINRLSIGVQSFDPAGLVRLGRVHGRNEALAAVAAAREAGFDNINLDLMFGLPGQKLASALADLETAIRLNPDHISYYQLTLEPDTSFHSRPPAGLPDEAQIGEMQERGKERLEAGGYGQYEVSAYSLPGRQCRHNLNYWTFGDYLGIGAGAHSKLTEVESHRITRYHNPFSPKVYMAGEGGSARSEQILEEEDLVVEFMMNALRLFEGFSPERFEQRTGIPFLSIETAIRTAQGRGLLERSRDRIYPTPLGKRFLDDLLLLFVGKTEVPNS